MLKIGSDLLLSHPAFLDVSQTLRCHRWKKQKRAHHLCMSGLIQSILHGPIVLNIFVAHKSYITHKSDVNMYITMYIYTYIYMYISLSIYICIYGKTCFWPPYFFLTTPLFFVDPPVFFWPPPVFLWPPHVSLVFLFTYLSVYLSICDSKVSAERVAGCMTACHFILPCTVLLYNAIKILPKMTGP